MDKIIAGSDEDQRWVPEGGEARLAWLREQKRKREDPEEAESKGPIVAPIPEEEGEEEGAKQE